MKQKLLILLIAVMTSISAHAYDFWVDGIYYNILSSTEVEATGRIDNYSNYNCIIIPESVSYNGTTYSVTSIGYAAFAGSSALEWVKIPCSVTSIGESAFSHCSRLKSFYGKFASEDNRCLIVDGVLNSFAPAGLVTYSIPNSVTSIAGFVFDGCSGLESVEIPYSVTSIGERAFSRCSRLESFYGKFASEDNRCLIVDGVLNSFAPYNVGEYSIPNSVTSIGGYVFHDCGSLTSVEIPNSVISIRGGAFLGCRGLTSVEIPNSVTAIGDGAFARCSGLKSVEIGNSVTSIGNEAFAWCSGLTSVEIPNSVTSIGNSAFSECNLTEVTTAWDNPVNVYIGGNAFMKIGMITLYVPIGTTENYIILYPWNKFLEILEYVPAGGDGVVTIYAKKAVLIKTVASGIQICGTEQGEDIHLYDINGMLLDSVKTSDGDTTISANLQPGQIYIIRYGDKAIKYKF